MAIKWKQAEYIYILNRSGSRDWFFKDLKEAKKYFQHGYHGPLVWKWNNMNRWTTSNIEQQLSITKIWLSDTLM